MDYPKLRSVEAFPVEISGRQLICLRDPLNLTEKTLLLTEDLFYIVSLFDGQHSILDIQTAYTRRYGNLLLSDRVRQVIDELDSYLFLESERFGKFWNDLQEEFKRSLVRRATHAGLAYEADSQKLGDQINAFFTAVGGPGEPDFGKSGGGLKAIVVPHIDLRVGGPSYAWAYKEVIESSDADLFVILGVAHLGARNPFVLTKKDFETPLGVVETDKDFVEALTETCQTDLFEDEFSHKSEHSIEFQLIFLQHLLNSRRRFQIVPILCGHFEEALAEGRLPSEIPIISAFIDGLKRTIASSGRKICVIVSVDLTHIGQKFGDQASLTPGIFEWIDSEDTQMLRFVESMDLDSFYRSIQKDKNRRRVDGFPGIYVLLSTLDLKEGKLLKYDKMVDSQTQSVVSYASMAFY